MSTARFVPYTSRLIVDHDEFTHAEQVRLENKMEQVLAGQARILAALGIDPPDAGPNTTGVMPPRGNTDI
ncbi:hypothetical protein SAMN05444365_102215 [Micromonospora pattaloongensis]|uniref:Uncharacterized protein n=1 Tax=Micromonospora pattaloongensis TaxID=405436 RepID=A0A1H3JRN1_9ACTN|nr:hypothetical protein SAMN05444365_102215 [Micromonospora pattaloongensis]